MVGITSRRIFLFNSSHSAIESLSNCLKKNITIISTNYYLQVIVLAIVVSFLCRNTNKDETAEEFIDDEHIELNNDEEYLHSIRVCFR